jgi:hypothetical protein
MKKYLLIVAVLLVYSAATAQSNPNEAKAAYLLAEESYEKGDYKSAIAFLLQARDALGSANCKMLYLQVMATKELYAKDTSANSKLLPLILEFEKSPDYTDFNEEKKLEITKLKLLVKNDMQAARERSDAETRSKEAENKLKMEREKNMSDVANQWAPLGITLSELDSAKPAWNIKAWKRSSWSKDFDILHPPAFSYTKSSYPFTSSKENDADTARVANLAVAEGRVTCICSYVVDFDGATRQDDGAGYTVALQAMKQSTLQLSEKTQIRPGGFGEYAQGGYTMKNSEFHSDKYMIIDFARYRPKGSSGLVQLLRCAWSKNIVR